MKKLLYPVLALALILTGCENYTAETKTVPAEVFIVEDGVTHDGIKRGDGPEDFKNAYGDYPVQVAYNDTAYSGYTEMSLKKIPFDENISTLVAGIFVDGEPFSEAELAKENEIEEADLPELLSSPEYLRAHEVEYLCLRFTWEDGAITDIDSVELNYNESYDVPRLDD